MARKKVAHDKEFFIKGKQEITDPDAPVISNEFIDKSRPEGDYIGQTIEVQSETKLESDRGEGEEMVLRAYEFATDPRLLNDVSSGKIPMPSNQELFNASLKGIMGYLWQDGLQPAEEIPPRVIFSKDRSKYIIMVGARAAHGQFFIDKPTTLGEIVKKTVEQHDLINKAQNESRTDKDSLQRSVPVSSTKKKTSGRATKAPK